jgi:dihydropteroate synthase
MGILNLTPDSFSGDGLAGAQDRALERAVQMLAEGADILDIGAESTRPGSAAISPDEEQERLLPALSAILRERPDAILSVDTYHAATARAALLAGAEIVNDVSGFLWDGEMPKVCAAAGCGVVLMHTRGRPQEWATLPPLAPGELLPTLERELAAQLAVAQQAGIALDRIVLDPGYGFGKAASANYTLLAEQRQLLRFQRPLLIGLSRKGFLGRTLGAARGTEPPPATERDTASAAAAVATVLAGASVVRAHNVRMTADAVAVADELLRANFGA